MSFLNQLKSQAKELQSRQERESADLGRNTALAELRVTSRSTICATWRGS